MLKEKNFCFSQEVFVVYKMLHVYKPEFQSGSQLLMANDMKETFKESTFRVANTVPGAFGRSLEVPAAEITIDWRLAFLLAATYLPVEERFRLYRGLCNKYMVWRMAVKMPGFLPARVLPIQRLGPLNPYTPWEAYVPFDSDVEMRVFLEDVDLSSTRAVITEMDARLGIAHDAFGYYSSLEDDVRDVIRRARIMSGYYVVTHAGNEWTALLHIQRRRIDVVAWRALGVYEETAPITALDYALQVDKPKKRRKKSARRIDVDLTDPE